MQLKDYKGTEISNDLEALSWGLNGHAKFYSRCIMNRVRFITASREAGLKAKNSGVSIVREHDEGQVVFYGLLTNVI